MDIKWMKGHKKARQLVKLAKCFLRSESKGVSEGLHLWTPWELQKAQVSPSFLWKVGSLSSWSQTILDKEEMYTVTFGNFLSNPGGIRLLAYWCNHCNIPISDCNDLDWKAFCNVCHQLPMGINWWISKFYPAHIGVGNMLWHRD